MALTACTSHSGSRAQLIENDGQFTLLKNGEPYTILGVGGTSRLDMLASIGGNTIRTWDAEGIGDLLDEAHANGISVVAGIWLEHQRHGFDYRDPAQRKEQLDRVERLVKEHRNHPALLAWSIGNEVELGGDIDIAIQQINDAAAIVKRLDPHHPRMTVVAEIGDDKATRIQSECPDINILGINAYGGLGSLTTRLAQQGYTGAWAVTEFGVVGHWETGNSPWGAPYEQPSSDKAQFQRKVYEVTIEPNLGKQCIGSFAFLWGHKQEKTATWYGMMLESGEITERVEAMGELWSGKAVKNHVPRVHGIEILDANPLGLAANKPVSVRVNAEDPDGDSMLVEWEVLPESSAQSMGGDFEKEIEAVEVHIELDGALGATITMPDAQGGYRIFVTVRDGNGHAGTANLPVYVAGPESD